MNAEVRERAVWMVHEHRGEYPSLWAAIDLIAPNIACLPQTLNQWVRRHEVYTGNLHGVTTDERELVKPLDRDYARRIVGWRQSISLRTDFVLDALERAFYDCQPERTEAMVLHIEKWLGKTE